MKIQEVHHPMLQVKLTVLRDKNTRPMIFKQTVNEMVLLLTYEATKNISVRECEIETPLTKTKGTKLEKPKPIIIPILRAGLGMLDGISKLMPTAEIGFLGMQRDHKTLEVTTYATKIPEDLTGRECYLIDPMIGTGGTTIDAVRYLEKLNPKKIVSLNILASQEGIDTIQKEVGDRDNLELYVAQIDPDLNEKGYIVPGLGDAGDRIFGVVC